MKNNNLIIKINNWIKHNVMLDNEYVLHFRYISNECIFFTLEHSERKLVRGMYRPYGEFVLCDLDYIQKVEVGTDTFAHLLWLRRLTLDRTTEYHKLYSKIPPNVIHKIISSEKEFFNNEK